VLARMGKCLLFVVLATTTSNSELPEAETELLLPP
jgi:hypothetical protein